MKEITSMEAIKLFDKCLDELYRNSKPPTTWSEIKKKYSGTGISFYEKHAISEDDYNAIVKKYDTKLPKYYKKHLALFLLSFAPTTRGV